MSKQTPKAKKVDQPLPENHYGALRTVEFAQQIYADPTLSLPFKVVLTELLFSYNDKRDACDYLSQRDIMKKHQVGRETVQLAIKAGTARGYLDAFQAGEREKNQYIWKWDRDPAKFSAEARPHRRPCLDATKKKLRTALDKRLGRKAQVDLREVHGGPEGGPGVDFREVQGGPQGSAQYYMSLPDESLLDESTHTKAHAAPGSEGSNTQIAEGEPPTVPLPHLVTAGERPAVPNPHSAAAGKPHAAANGSSPSREEASASVAKSQAETLPPALPKSQAAQQTYFDRLVAAYPPNNGSDKEARVVFRAKLKAGADPEAIIAGAQRYAVSQRFQEQRYVTHLKNWLGKELWTEERLPEPVDPAHERIRNSKNPLTEAILEKMRQDNIKKYLTPKPELKLVGGGS